MLQGAQVITPLTPTLHFVSLAQARGAGLEVVWPSLPAMAAIALAFCLVSLPIFRRSIAARG